MTKINQKLSQTALGKREFRLGDVTYLMESDEEYDYLQDISNNQVKVNLRFSKNHEKNEFAKMGLKVFFSRLI